MTPRRAMPLLALIAILCSFMSASPAFADDAANLTPIQKANPGIDANVIASLPQVVKDSSVKIDKSYSPGMPIIYPDGTPVPGQSDRAVAAAASCGGFVVAPPTGAWGLTSVSPCAVFGSPGYKLTYTWSHAIGVYTTGVVRGLAFTSSGSR